MAVKTVFLSLGSNVGDRRRNLESALEKLQQARISITARSSIYETEPRDVLDQPLFLNMVVECRTSYFPLQLMTILQRIQRQLGRVRAQETLRGGPRKIDVDILLMGKVAMKTPELEIPHPRMFDRRFVLEPLLEIAPNLRHPATGVSLSSLLPKVATQKIRRISD
jgi:2-amino-4-hydroxy-6-hydroxymethyldihydropteridine diphosphokinase